MTMILSAPGLKSRSRDQRAVLPSPTAVTVNCPFPSSSQLSIPVPTFITFPIHTFINFVPNFITIPIPTFITIHQLTLIALFIPSLSSPQFSS